MSKKVCLTKELEDFLRKEKVLTKFKKNVKGNSTKRLPIDLISAGFLWDDSPEGLQFWIDLNNEFLNH